MNSLTKRFNKNWLTCIVRQNEGSRPCHRRCLRERQQTSQGRAKLRERVPLSIRLLMLVGGKAGEPAIAACARTFSIYADVQSSTICMCWPARSRKLLRYRMLLDYLTGSLADRHLPIECIGQKAPHVCTQWPRQVRRVGKEQGCSHWWFMLGLHHIAHEAIHNMLHNLA